MAAAALSQDDLTEHRTVMMRVSYESNQQALVRLAQLLSDKQKPFLKRKLRLRAYFCGLIFRICRSPVQKIKTK